MKISKLIAILGLIAMTAVLINGFVNGNFSQDGAELLANPWGIGLLCGSLRWLHLVLNLDRVSRKEFS